MPHPSPPLIPSFTSLIHHGVQCTPLVPLVPVIRADHHASVNARASSNEAAAVADRNIESNCRCTADEVSTVEIISQTTTMTAPPTTSPQSLAFHVQRQSAWCSWRRIDPDGRGHNTGIIVVRVRHMKRTRRRRLTRLPRHWPTRRRHRRRAIILAQSSSGSGI